MKKLHAFLLCSIIGCTTSALWGAEQNNNLLTQNQVVKEALQSVLNKALRESTDGSITIFQKNKKTTTRPCLWSPELAQILSIAAQVDMVTLKKQELRLKQEER